MQQTTLLISTALTAFLLIVLGGIIAVFTQQLAVVANPTTTSVIVPVSTNGAPVQGATAETGEFAVALSPEDAHRLARAQAPTTMLSSIPELVSFEGMIAYEVVFDQGKVYIDANNGHVLYNSISTVTRNGTAPGSTALDDGTDTYEHDDEPANEQYQDDENYEEDNESRRHDKHKKYRDH